jgi:dTDP-glucose pyrophosphorylase
MSEPRPIRRALVPAAGAGSRMGYLSAILPKCMYPVADKPIIHRVVENARLLGAREFIIITHFMEDIVRDYFRSVLIPQFKIEVTFVHQNALTGLADAIALGQPYLDEPFAVILGDDYTVATDFDNLSASLDRHRHAVVVEGIVSEKDPAKLRHACCVTRHPSGRISRIVEKPKRPFGPIRGTGIYLFRPEIFAAIRETPVTAVRHEREITETIRLLAGEGRAYAEFIRGTNLNINSFDDLLLAWNTHFHLEPFLDSCRDRNGSAT